MEKKYFRDGSSFSPIAIGLGSCIASDRIVVDGKPVGYMYREDPRDSYDSGWCFFAGDETDDYVNDPVNLGIFDVNTIANYDPEITPYLDSPAGSTFVRNGKMFISETVRVPR